MSTSPFPRSIGRTPATKRTARRLTFEPLEARRLLASDGTVMEFVKIADSINGGPNLNSDDYFGFSSASVGDLDGDGLHEIVGGARGDDTGGQYRGAVHVLFMKADGTARSTVEIASGTGGGPTLNDFDNFGRDVGGLGDLDGDGVDDLVVGADRDRTGGFSRGAAYVLLMKSDGTVKGSQKIAHGVGGLSLSNFDFFGSAVDSPGDLDGDGVRDLVVGAFGADSERGVLHVIFLNADGTPKSLQKIGNGVGGGPALNVGAAFGNSVTSLGDLDGDGVTDLAVGAYGNDSVHVLFMKTDGTVKSSQRIAPGVSGGPPAGGDGFGASVAGVGDMDGDGVLDLAVGAHLDDTGGGGGNQGAVYVLFMNTDGTVRTFQKIGNGVGGGPPLNVSDFFGRSVTAVGDLNGDGAIDLAAGADDDDSGGDDTGAVYVLLMTPNPATVTGEILNGGSANRSGLATLTLEFDNPATVSGVTSLKVWNHTTGAPLDISSATLTNNGTTAVTWDFSGITFPDGYYTATLPKEEARLVASHTHLFHVLAGDSNGDAAVGFPDLFDLQNNFNLTGVLRPGDLDGDGTVGFGDVFVLQNTFNKSLTALAMDFGDAPESGTSFPTRLPSGARHVLGSDLRLGASVDGEANGQPDATAAGDGADEDGVTFGTLQAGNASASVTVTANVPGSAVLNAWIDFNADGNWDDAGEQVFVDQALASGTNNLTAAIPSGATAGSTFARFRVTGIAGYSYFGLARDGEVEDYQVTIVAAASKSIRGDSSGLLDTRAGAFANERSPWSTPRISGRRHLVEPFHGSEQLAAPEVIDLAIVEVASTQRRPKQVTARLSSRHDRLIDQLFEEKADFLLQDNAYRGDL